MQKKKVIIIGGGFAGIHLAKNLGGKKGMDVVLVDQNNYNFFTPLLYQVAAGLLDVPSICIPYRTIFKDDKNLHFKLGELQEIVLNKKIVRLSSGLLHYDYLIMATGTKSNYFGMENIKKYALPMKSVNEAVKLRNYLLLQAENYINETNEREKKKMRNIVISGAGPSGVEVAGILAELRNRILSNIYPELDNENMHIYLVDGSPSVLTSFSKKSQKYSLQKLINLGVKVRLNTMVTDYKNDVVRFDDGLCIPTKTLIWTAGVIAIKFQGLPEESYSKENRLMVDQYNKVRYTENVFAIGDGCLQTSDPKFPKGHPQLASVAQQQGKFLAKNLNALINHRHPKPFRYMDKGTMAIIGRNMAVADLNIPKRTITGWFAWMSWLFVHLFLLLNYRNQFRTMWNWGLAYFGRAQSLGIMVDEYPTLNDKKGYEKKK